MLVHDYTSELLGSAYDPKSPVRNALLYQRGGPRGERSCEAVALAAELAHVHAAGSLAAPDVMNSFWTTYREAFRVWYRRAVTLADLPALIDGHDGSEFAEVNDLFAPFAALVHTRGNFILVPVCRDPQTLRPSSSTDFNLARHLPTQDYWDLTLAGIRTGRFSGFFGDHPVAPRFDITAMPGGFAGFVERNDLHPYLDDHGAVKPLWEGHLDEDAMVLPQAKADVEQFVANACAAITERGAALGV